MSTLQQKSRMSERLSKDKTPSFYYVDCDLEFKGKKISRLNFKTSGRSRRIVAKEIENEIKIKVMKISKIKK